MVLKLGRFGQQIRNTWKVVSRYQFYLWSALIFSSLCGQVPSASLWSRHYTAKSNLIFCKYIFNFCATSRTVLGSIPGGVTGFFSDIFPSDCTMALGSTQPIMKMSTRSIPGGKGGRCVSLTTSPPSSAECHENLGAWIFWNPLGHTWPVTGFLYFYIYILNFLIKPCSKYRFFGLCCVQSGGL